MPNYFLSKRIVISLETKNIGFQEIRPKNATTTKKLKITFFFFKKVFSKTICQKKFYVEKIIKKKIRLKRFLVKTSTKFVQKLRELNNFKNSHYFLWFIFVFIFSILIFLLLLILWQFCFFLFFKFCIFCFGLSYFIFRIFVNSVFSYF